MFNCSHVEHAKRFSRQVTIRTFFLILVLRCTIGNKVCVFFDNNKVMPINGRSAGY